MLRQPPSIDAWGGGGFRVSGQWRAVEFVLLGVGLVNALPPRPVRDALKAAGVGLEFMSTEAAARTYNVLASEGRRLAAALIAV